MSVEQKLRDYILENFLFTDDQSAIDNEDSFLKKGIIYLQALNKLKVIV